jgi:hypothetical protein
MVKVGRLLLFIKKTENRTKDNYDEENKNLYRQINARQRISRKIDGEYINHIFRNRLIILAKIIYCFLPRPCWSPRILILISVAVKTSSDTFWPMTFISRFSFRDTFPRIIA